MAKYNIINTDLADVFDNHDKEKYLFTLAWGDHIDVDESETNDRHICINTVKYKEQSGGKFEAIKTKAYICPNGKYGLSSKDFIAPLENSKVLKVNFVDVQQGDGTVIESPDGKIILVDGGDNVLFARYLASRYRDTSENNPLKIDCILVTHGDADHFAGLSEIHASEEHNESRKKLFIAPERVYHNGLVKRPSKDENGQKTPERQLLGSTNKVGDDLIITELFKDLIQVPDERMNEPFRRWKLALQAWNNRKKIEFERIAFGNDKAFEFFRNDEHEIEITALGPFLTQIDNVTGLKFLAKPAEGPRSEDESIDINDSDTKGLSASHTINGHSIVFRLRYGGFSFLFTGDLNDEAGRNLARYHQEGKINLRSDIFKVPHHGSADFSGAFISLTSPIISIVSSGDESAKKEYIHPRATLMGALGRHSRVNEPLIFVTELVAFFNLEGMVRLTEPEKEKKRGEFLAFSRKNYGMVNARTDGKRLLVYTDSGKSGLKEAYCYAINENGVPTPTEVRRI